MSPLELNVRRSKLLSQVKRLQAGKNRQNLLQKSSRTVSKAHKFHFYPEDWAIPSILLLVLFMGFLSRRLYFRARSSTRAQRKHTEIARKISDRRLVPWEVVDQLSDQTRLSPNGYVLARSRAGKDQYEHRIIAKEILGRPLETWEVVHHINGRRTDNRASNLCVMDSRNHDLYHEWYEQIFITYGNYPRRATQLQKLKNSFSGTCLGDI